LLPVAIQSRSLTVAGRGEAGLRLVQALVGAAQLGKCVGESGQRPYQPERLLDVAVICEVAHHADQAGGRA
jgi:hypothetical protein